MSYPRSSRASALSHAQRICREQGVTAESDGYEYCIAPSIRAVESGAPYRANYFARVTIEAREFCVGSGVQTDTNGFRACMDRETYARGFLVR